MKHNITLTVSGNKDEYCIYAEDEQLYILGVGDTIEEAYKDMLLIINEMKEINNEVANPYPDWFLNGDYTFSYKLDDAGLQERLNNQFTDNLVFA